MNIGQVSVMIAGMEWIAAAVVLREVSRLMGPSFHTTKSVHWVWRAVVWGAALICFVRGMTLWFPGKLIEVSRVSIMAPLGGLVVLGLSLWVLDWVMRDRAPPPISVQIMRLAALFGRNGPVKFAAMAVKPAAVGDAPPVDEPMGQRLGRLAVMMGALALLAAMAVFLAFNAGAGS